MAGLTTAVLPAARRQAMQWISTLQPSSVWTKDSSTSAALTHTRTANAIHAHVRCLLDRLPRESHRPCVSVRESQQRIDQRGETIDFFEHAADDFTICRFIAPAAQSNFADTANGSERCPQLV